MSRFTVLSLLYHHFLSFGGEIARVVGSSQVFVLNHNCFKIIDFWKIFCILNQTPLRKVLCIAHFFVSWWSFPFSCLFFEDPLKTHFKRYDFYFRCTFHANDWGFLCYNGEYFSAFLSSISSLHLFIGKRILDSVSLSDRKDFSVIVTCSALLLYNTNSSLVLKI